MFANKFRRFYLFFFCFLDVCACVIVLTILDGDIINFGVDACLFCVVFGWNGKIFAACEQCESLKQNASCVCVMCVHKHFNLYAFHITWEHVVMIYSTVFLVFFSYLLHILSFLFFSIPFHSGSLIISCLFLSFSFSVRTIKKHYYTRMVCNRFHHVPFILIRSFALAMIFPSECFTQLVISHPKCPFFSLTVKPFLYCENFTLFEKLKVFVVIVSLVILWKTRASNILFFIYFHRTRAFRVIDDGDAHVWMKSPLFLRTNSNVYVLVRVSYFFQVMPVLELAELEVRRRQLLPQNVSIKWTQYDDKCDASYATISAMDGYGIDCSHVLFGPACEFALGECIVWICVNYSNDHVLNVQGIFSPDFQLLQLKWLEMQSCSHLLVTTMMIIALDTRYLFFLYLVIRIQIAL